MLFRQFSTKHRSTYTYSVRRAGVEKALIIDPVKASDGGYLGSLIT